VAVALVAVALLFMAPAGAQTSGGDARAERDRVRAEKAEVAGEVDVLQADQAQVAAALAAVEDNLRGQQAAYADADRAANQAEQAAEVARQEEAAKKVEIAALRDQLATQAVEAYVNPPSQDLFTTFEASSATDAARKKALLGVQNGRDRDLLDELRAAEAALEAARLAAEEADTVARAQRAEAAQRLGEVEAAQAQQAAFVEQVSARLDAKLSESAALAEVDAELSQQIAAEEAALAAQLKRDRDAAAAAAARSRSSASSSGSVSSGSVSITPPPVSANIPLATVGGITVASSIAGQLQSMLSAAAADGVTLSGSGYRDSSRQIALRRQNCGSSDYAVYQMSAEGCSPPTARPGASKHEQGLAIDFANCSSRSTACFQWLAGNAASFGFFNLPSEPWHWSTTGS
jgi:septal ring factor EnvC (AmiA/AmiB activator)